MTDGIGPVDAGSSDLGIIVIASMRSSLPPEALDKSNAIPGYDNFELLAEAYVGPSIRPTRARVKS